MTQLLKLITICLLATSTTLAKAPKHNPYPIKRLPILVSVNNEAVWVPIYGNTGVIPYFSKDGQLMVDVKALCGFFAAKCQIDYKNKTINAYRSYLDSQGKPKGRRQIVAFEKLKQMNVPSLYGENFASIFGEQSLGMLFGANNERDNSHYFETAMVPITRFAKVFDFDTSYNPKTRMVNLTVKSDCVPDNYLCSVFKNGTPGNVVHPVGPAFVDVAIGPNGNAISTYGNRELRKPDNQPGIDYKPMYDLILQGDTKAKFISKRLITSTHPGMQIENPSGSGKEPVCLYSKKETKCHVYMPLFPTYMGGVLVYVSIGDTDHYIE